MVFGHGNFDSFELRSEDDEDVSTKRTIFRKPYTPKRWKFFRTSGKNPVYQIDGSALGGSSVAFKLPKWMRAYLRDADGNVYPADLLGYTKVTLGSGDYLTMGGVTTVSMRDADSRSMVPTSFPQLSFSQDGVEYSLRWNDFAKDRKVTKGGWKENWGYAREGHPVRGMASTYDMNLELDWDSKSRFWWLIAGAATIGGLFWFSRNRKV